MTIYIYRGETPKGSSPYEKDDIICVLGTGKFYKGGFSSEGKLDGEIIDQFEDKNTFVIYSGESEPEKIASHLIIDDDVDINNAATVVAIYEKTLGKPFHLNLQKLADEINIRYHNSGFDIPMDPVGRDAYKKTTMDKMGFFGIESHQVIMVFHVNPPEENAPPFRPGNPIRNFRTDSTL